MRILTMGLMMTTLTLTGVCGAAVTAHAGMSMDSTPAGGGILHSIQATPQADAGAKDFIDGMGKKAISFLGNEAYTQEQKEAEFRRLLKNSFDMKTIGRFALGRYWSTATAQQQQEYLKLFEDMVVDVYAQRFNEYKGQALKIGGMRPDGEKDTLVTSHIVDPNGSGKFQVDWRVRKREGGYKIVDVIIEGVSMSLTQRSDFSSVIQRGGGDMQALLLHLRGTQSN